MVFGHLFRHMFPRPLYAHSHHNNAYNASANVLCNRCNPESVLHRNVICWLHCQTVVDKSKLFFWEYSKDTINDVELSLKLVLNILL